MREFWHRFTTSRYWFLGTLAVGFFLVLFFWHLFDPQGYAKEISSWLASLKAIFVNILTLVIVGIGAGIVWRGVFGKKPGPKSH